MIKRELTSYTIVHEYKCHKSEREYTNSQKWANWLTHAQTTSIRPSCSPRLASHSLFSDWTGAREKGLVTPEEAGTT